MNFLFIGNRFSIDLANTVVAFNGEETDLLSESARVSEWLAIQDLSLSDAMSEQQLTQLKHLRTIIREWILLKPKNTDKELAILNEHIRQPHVARKLLANGSEFSFEPVDQVLSPQNLLTKVATDFANLLVSDQLKQVKQCSSDQCILLFLDTSKSKRRRWCSMTSCGNRAKAAAFYQNRRELH